MNPEIKVTYTFDNLCALVVKDSFSLIKQSNSTVYFNPVYENKDGKNELVLIELILKDEVSK